MNTCSVFFSVYILVSKLSQLISVAHTCWERFALHQQTEIHSSFYTTSVMIGTWRFWGGLHMMAGIQFKQRFLWPNPWWRWLETPSLHYHIQSLKYFYTNVKSKAYLKVWYILQIVPNSDAHWNKLAGRYFHLLDKSTLVTFEAIPFRGDINIINNQPLSH